MFNQGVPLHIQSVWTCPDAGLISYSWEQIKSDNYIFKDGIKKSNPTLCCVIHSELIW